jgi:hypothetical protein
MLPGFIFGEGTSTPDAQSLQKRRQVVDQLLASSMPRAPQTFGEGLTAIGMALAGRMQDKRLREKEDAERERVGGQFSQITGALLGGGQGTQSSPDPMAGNRPMVQSDASRMGPVGKGAVDPAMITQGLVQRGLPQHVAEAFVVNMKDESGLNPGINEAAPLVPGSRGGFGLYQLTGPRRRAYEAFAAQRGVDPSDVDAQLDFLMTELQGPEARAAQNILSAPDTATAAQAIVNDFLRPAPEHRTRRAQQYAQLGGGQQTQPQGMGGIDPTVMQLAQLIENPYLDPGLRMIAQQLVQQRMQAADPMRQMEMERQQIEMQRLRDPMSDPMTALQMERVQLELERMRNPQPDIPDSVRALELRADAAGLQRGTPEYADFMMRGGATPAQTNVTVNTGEGDKFYEKLDQGQATMFQTLMDEGVQAGRTMQQINRLGDILTRTPTGAGAAFKTALGEYGIPTEGLDDLQAAQALINQIVPQQRQPGSGPMSDADLALFKQSVPRLINQPGGNQIIINRMRGIAEYQVQQAQIAAAVANREISPADGRKALSELANPLADIGKDESKPEEAGAFQGGAQPKPEDVPADVWNYLTDEEQRQWLRGRQ